MRRYWVVALAVLTLLGVLSPPVAQAQAPTPQVTISGLLQQSSTVGQNFFDGNFTRYGDSTWQVTTRARPDITAQVGAVKMVLGFEFDVGFGQTGTTDSIVTGAGGTAGGVQLGGHNGGFDLNTDVNGIIELKWAYTEFPFTGSGSLLPFVPVPTVARIGAQPFAVTYKPSTLATGDFAGLNLVTTWTPAIKSHLLYAQLEEQGQGVQGPATRCNNAGTGLAAGAACRGDDWAGILGVEVTPMKGLDIRPIFAVFNGFGSITASGRTPAALPASTNLVDEESRYTVGVDTRWTLGNLFVDPTFFYQFGHRESRPAAPSVTTAHRSRADISAWLFDIRGGYRMGPLLLEAMFAYASGNKARDNLAKEISYYAPIDTDTGYGAIWQNILALGVDSTAVGAQNGLGAQISYFEYGRIQGGARATYSWTPSLDTYVTVSPTWTAREVDTDLAATTRAKTCIGNGASNIPCDFEGDSSYLGTEANVGLVWRFAPNVRFDLVGYYFFAGSALDGAELAPGTPSGTTGATRESRDAMGIGSKLSFNY